MPFDMRSGYGMGGVGAGNFNSVVPPFDLRHIQETYGDGSITPNMIISFGEEAKANNKIADLENYIYLLDMKCDFKTPTLGLRAQNLHRSGTTTASPFWGVIPRNLVAVSLMKSLHTNSLKEITVKVLAYVGETGGETIPIVTETKTFHSCFIIYLEPWGQGDFIVFAFTFVDFKWELDEYSQDNPNNKVGTRVYEFNFGSTKGAESS